MTIQAAPSCPSLGLPDEQNNWEEVGPAPRVLSESILLETMPPALFQRFSGEPGEINVQQEVFLYNVGFVLTVFELLVPMTLACACAAASELTVTTRRLHLP